MSRYLIEIDLNKACVFNHLIFLSVGICHSFEICKGPPPSGAWEPTSTGFFLPMVFTLFFSLCSHDKELEALVSKKLEKDGMVGMAVAGGAALAVGGKN